MTLIQFIRYLIKKYNLTGLEKVQIINENLAGSFILNNKKYLFDIDQNKRVLLVRYA